MASRVGLSRTSLLRQVFSALNFKGELSKTKVEATVIHPGVSYGDFQGRSPAIWRLMKVMEGSRFFAHHSIATAGENNFLDYDKLTDDRMTFIGSTEFIIDKAMYDSAVIKSPIDVKLQPYHIGKSSLSTQARVFVHKSDQLLLSNINQVISIDRSSRRPLPLPHWWTEKYSPATRSDKPLIVQSESRPESAVRFEVVVNWSDTDFYEHSNWSSYPKFCVDAANVASVKKLLKHISPETVRENAVKTLRVRYSGESLLGDTLEIFTWETAEQPNSLRFEICKESKPICFVFLEYFEQSS